MLEYVIIGVLLVVMVLAWWQYVQTLRKRKRHGRK